MEFGNFIPVISVDYVVHTSEMPFCFTDPTCPCHDDHEEIQKKRSMGHGWVND